MLTFPQPTSWSPEIEWFSNSLKGALNNYWVLKDSRLWRSCHLIGVLCLGQFPDGKQTMFLLIIKQNASERSSPGVIGFFTAWPDSNGLPPTLDAETCLLLELWEALMWALIWGAVNWRFLRASYSNELGPCSWGNSWASFPRQSSWEPRSSRGLTALATAFGRTFFIWNFPH